MKQLLKWLPLFLLVVFLTSSHAETTPDEEYTFTLHIGAFVKAKLADFRAIHSFGYLYSQPAENNLTRIYMGDYESENLAYRTLKQVKGSGYPDAFVTRRRLATGTNTDVIHLGTETVGADIDWAYYNQAGNLFTTLNGNQVQILTGPFTTLTEANNMLVAIKQAGFQNASIQTINSVLLHKVTSFEADMEMKDITLIVMEEQIPEEYDQVVLTEKTVRTGGPDLMVKPKIKEEPAPEPIPETYDEVVLTEKTPTKVATPKVEKKAAPKKEKAAPVKKEAPKVKKKKVVKPFVFNVPRIRPNVKRTSALELQRVLKPEKAYTGSLDGLYGKGTAKGWKTFLATNKAVRKYQAMTTCQEKFTDKGTDNILQHYINTLLTDSDTALKGLENSKEPIAKAYRAYYLFENGGDKEKVNVLMNTAIKETFVKKKIENRPPFNYKAMYAYKDLDQLILHLSYIHNATRNTAIPAWIFQQHKREAMKALEPGTHMSPDAYDVQSMDEFLNWDELTLLETIAEDLSPSEVSAKVLKESSSRRARLLMVPKALSTEEYINIKGWNRSLWSGLDAWMGKDAVLKKWGVPLKAAYFQTQVRLEDYYMDKGFKPKEATGLALTTLQTLVAHYLEKV